MSVYAERRSKVAERLRAEGIRYLLIEDSEGRRNSSLRYLTGQPGDALLFLADDAHALLLPWDLPLARMHADVEEMLPYNDFGRRPLPAVLAFLNSRGLLPHEETVLEVGKDQPHPFVSRLQQELSLKYPKALVVCKDEGTEAFIEVMRSVKDEGEIAALKKCASIIDELIDGLEGGIRGGSLRSETDIALFIEKESRSLGAEGTSFETIAAGPSRSFGIHAFPGYGPGAFAAPGLSILDFGVRVDGYAGDVTLTLASGGLSHRQELFLRLVQEAYAAALDMIAPGAATWEIAERVNTIFAGEKLSMPHALGHGIGLDVHELPFFRGITEGGAVLKPGMVLAVEPGLYDPEIGGVRCENDVLVTMTGREVLTHSRILYR